MIDCDQTAMALPPVTSAEFLIDKSMVKRLGGISEIPLLPLWASSVNGMDVN
jgi:hypothetical protein